MQRLTHGLDGSGADIEYRIIKEHTYGYTLEFFDDEFYLPKSCFCDNIIKSNCIYKLRQAIREVLCRQPVIKIKRH
jgi:hypothetical protein